MSIWYYLVDEEKAKLGKNLNFSCVGENIGLFRIMLMISK